MQTVFFGPYIGEFGWEILWWHGWVRELCRTVFPDARKIVASFPGRYPLYQDADEVWAHPDWFCRMPISQRAYFADFWRNGFPLGNVARKRFKYFIRPVQESVPIRPNGEWPEAEAAAYRLLDEYRRRLPVDTEYFVPFLMNRCPKYGIPIGLEIVGEHPSQDRHFVIHRPEFVHQRVECLTPTERGLDYLARRLRDGEPLICVLPRVRPVRRPDKNWPKARYDELIQRLKRRRPDHRIAILGDPRGAYYVDGVPSGCLDLVNVDPGIRLDAHIAVLNRAALAVGGMSGGMVLALYCGCPSLVFGFVNEQHMYERDNHLRTLLVYYPYMTARASEIARLADGMLEGRIPPPDRPQWDPTEYLGLLAIGLGRVRRFFSV